MSSEPVSKALVAIQNLIEAGRPLIYIQSPEEGRVVSLLRSAADRHAGGRLPLLTWSVTEGLCADGKPHKLRPDGARGILDFIIGHDKPAIFLLKDFHEHLRDYPEIRRRLRDAYYACSGSGKFLVIGSAVKCIPGEIEREVAYAKLPMPDLVELEAVVREEAGALAAAGKAATLGACPKTLQIDRLEAGPTPVLGQALNDETVYVLSRALQGLSLNETRHALRFAAAERGRLDASVVPLLQEEKRLLVRRTGLMEYVPDTVGMDHLGGLDVLKIWLAQRRGLFFSRESISAEIVPKGVLLMGVSGCGKSLSARVIASVFGLPLYRVDMSQIFSSGLGNAERLFADACRTMEEIAPAVVWFDEIENSISHEHQDNTGVLDRIFGYFLTWMQEKPTGLFVAATANRIDLLPAEMIRKGRFDQVFFIDLPHEHEREEIFRIHLSRRNVDLAGVSLGLLAKRTDGWTGAEIEQAVISALTAARIANQPVNDDALFPALREIVPLSRTMKEQVAHVRAWAFDRAVKASSKT